MNSILTINGQEEISLILALDQSAKCLSCNSEERSTALSIIEDLCFWWLSPEFRLLTGVQTVVEGKQNFAIASMSALFKFRIKNTPKPQSAFAILSQHDGSGIHFQLQIPHPDIANNRKPSPIRDAVPRSANSKRNLRK